MPECGLDESTSSYPPADDSCQPVGPPSKSPFWINEPVGVGDGGGVDVVVGLGVVVSVGLGVVVSVGLGVEVAVEVAVGLGFGVGVGGGPVTPAAISRAIL